MAPRRATVNHETSLQPSVSTQSTNSALQPSQPVTPTGADTAAAKKHGGRSKGARNYHAEEINELLRLLEVHLPSGSDAWEVVATLYNSKFPDRRRDAESLKSKYHHIRDAPKPTGSADYTPDTARAIRIDDLIKAKEAQIEVGGEAKTAEYHFEEIHNETAQNAAEPPSPAASQAPSESSITNSTVSSTSSPRYNAVHGAAAVRQKRKRMDTILEVMMDKIQESTKADEKLSERIANIEKNLVEQQSKLAEQQNKYAEETAARQRLTDQFYAQLTATLADISDTIKKRKI